MKGKSEPYIPTSEAIGNYFASAVFPLRLSNGAVYLPDDIGPFALKHVQAIVRSKRGYLGLGPASVDVAESLSSPRFSHASFLRSTGRTTWMYARILRMLPLLQGDSPSLFGVRRALN
jgi:hypothetical protein